MASNVLNVETAGRSLRENPGTNSYDEATKEKFLRAYHERTSLRGLTRIFGVSRNTVSSWLKKVTQLPPLEKTLHAAEGEKGQCAFAEFLKLPFPLLPDTDRNLSILYCAAQSPNQTSSRMSVLIDKQGIVRWIDKQITPTTHGLDVVAKVEELEKLYSQKESSNTE